MNLLLVTFSLRNQYYDYGQFWVELRGNCLQWWHYIEQTVVAATSLGPDEFAEKLSPHLMPTDSLLVVKIEPHNFQGWLPKEAWDWLNNVSGYVLRTSRPLLAAPPPSVLPPLPPLPKPRGPVAASDAVKALGDILSRLPKKP